MILERAENLHAAREELERPGVERLDPAGIDDGGLDSLGFQKLGGFQRHLAEVAEAEEGDIGAVAQDLGLADFKQLRGRLRNGTHAGAARVADGDRPLVVVGHGP